MALKFERLTSAPILSAHDVKPSGPDLNVVGVFNPGACRFGDEALLLVRVAETYASSASMVCAAVVEPHHEDYRIKRMEWHRKSHAIDVSDPRHIVVDGERFLTSVSHFRVARSFDGIDFKTDETPTFWGERPDESYGVEDPRITQIGRTYWITYTSVGPNGFSVSLATTTDFQRFERHGVILPPENKDACLLPKKIQDRYWMLHRPQAQFLGAPSIWMAESPDGLHWGAHQCLLVPSPTELKIGAGPPPLLTPNGWLCLYHACDKHQRYTMRAFVTDLESPHRVVAQLADAVLEPELDYEKEGFFSQVVFSNGAVIAADGRIFMYYGASDSVVGVAVADASALAWGATDARAPSRDASRNRAFLPSSSRKK